MPPVLCLDGMGDLFLKPPAFFLNLSTLLAAVASFSKQLQELAIYCVITVSMCCLCVLLLVT